MDPNDRSKTSLNFATMYPNIFLSTKKITFVDQYTCDVHFFNMEKAPTCIRNFGLTWMLVWSGSGGVAVIGQAGSNPF